MILYSSTREDVTAWGSRGAHVARRATRDDNMPPKEGGGHGLIGSKTKARSKAQAWAKQLEAKQLVFAHPFVKLLVVRLEEFP